MPPTARENTRFARLVAYSGRRSGVRSAVAKAVGEANRLYRHMESYQADRVSRETLQAAGKVLCCKAPVNRNPDGSKPWSAHNPDDIYELPVGGLKMGDFRLTELIFAYILQGAKGDAKGGSEAADIYAARFAACEMLHLSEMSAKQLIELANDPAVDDDELKTAVLAGVKKENDAKSKALQEKQLADGRPTLSWEVLAKGVRMAATVAAAMNFEMADAARADVAMCIKDGNHGLTLLWLVVFFAVAVTILVRRLA